MFKLLILIASSLAVCKCVDYDIEDKYFHLSDEYKKINYHLFDHVESDDIETNMREAKRWLDEEVRKSSDEELKEALELFTSMDTMKMCTEESYQILGGNDFLTGYQARDIDKSYGESTKVLEIVAHYQTKHARECIPKYLKTLQEKYEQVGESVTQKVYKIAQLFKDQPYNVFGELIHSLITEFAKNDPDKQYLGRVPNKREGGRVLDEVKLRGLYNKYLIEPCTKFVSMNKDGWLKIYKFDNEWVELDEIPEDDQKLLSGFSERYNVCGHLIGKSKEELYQLFKEQADHN